MKFEELHNDKETNDEYLLNTVKESLNKGELCLFMSETGTFMSKGENDDTEETVRKLLLVLLSGFISMKKATQFDICLLYTSPSPRDRQKSRMPSSA